MGNQVLVNILTDGMSALEKCPHTLTHLLTHPIDHSPDTIRVTCEKVRVHEVIR